MHTMAPKPTKVQTDVAKYHGNISKYAKQHRVGRNKAILALQEQLAYTLHRPVRQKHKRLPTLVFNTDEEWQADIAEMQSFARENRGMRYLLTCIDILSEYAWVIPMKTKTGADVQHAFQSIFSQGRIPQTIQTDQGKEFYNSTVKKLFDEYGIHHFSTRGNLKAAVVERFNRTLKGLMYRLFTAYNTKRYIDFLDPLVEIYNTTLHRSIGMAPDQVNEDNEEEVWNRLYQSKLLPKPKSKAPTFKVGDVVRISRKRHTFHKSYLPQWSEQLYRVSRVVSHPALTTYRIKEWDDTPISGTYYAEDLQKVTKMDDVFRVEKILQYRGNAVKVRWVGHLSMIVGSYERIYNK